MELSFSQNSKKCNLEMYENIDPWSLNIYGLKIHNSGPEIIAGRLESIDDGNFCKLILKDKLEVENPGCLKNRILAEALIKSNGMDLSRLPQISISLLPEMVGKNGEIRRGLVDIVMQIFDPTCEGKSLIQIVNEGLDKLADITPPAKKEILMNAVEFQMGLLISKHLKEYLEYKDGKYKATEKFKATHHSTRETVSNGIKDWAFSKQSTLNGYSENDLKKKTKKKGHKK